MKLISGGLKRKTVFIFPLLIIIILTVERLCGAVAEEGPIVNLRAPLFAAPAIVLPGQSVFIKVAAGARLESAWLENSFGNAARLVIDRTADGYSASPTPALKPGLYDLRAVTVGADGKSVTETQPRAVAVFDKFKSDFDFVFISDVHFGAAETRRVGLDEKNVYRQRRAVFDALKSMNFEFILLGGDLVLYPDNYNIAYPESYDFLTYYIDRPVFIVPGNHDLYNKQVDSLGRRVFGTEYWARYYGPEYKAFKYGTIKFIGLNSCDWPPEYFDWGSHKASMTGALLNSNMQQEQFDWLKGELAKSKDASEIVVFTHIPLANYAGGSRMGLPPEILPGVKKDSVIGLLTSAGVRNVFVGHVHVYKENQLAPGLVEYVNRNIGGMFMESEDAGFEVIHVRGGRIANVEHVEITVK